MHHSEAALALSSPCTIGCQWPRDRRVHFSWAAYWAMGPRLFTVPACSEWACRSLGPGEKMIGSASCHWLDFGIPVPTPSLRYGSSPPSLGCHPFVVSLDSSPRYTFGQEPPPISSTALSTLLHLDFACMAVPAWTLAPALGVVWQKDGGGLLHSPLSPCLSFPTCTVGLWTRLVVPGLSGPFPLVLAPKQLLLSSVLIR